MDVTARPGQTLGRDISRGEIVEAEIDAFIAKRHGQRVKAKGERAEEAAWRESERRHEAARREANRLAWADTTVAGGALQGRPPS